MIVVVKFDVNSSQKARRNEKAYFRRSLSIPRLWGQLCEIGNEELGSQTQWDSAR